MNNVKIVSVITVIDRERNPDAETIENGGERKIFKISVEKVQNRIHVGHVVEWVEGRTT